MTDEELVADAHAFAKVLAGRVSDEKSAMLDGMDGAPWAIIVLTELARILAVSYVAATDRPDVFQLFMRNVAEGAAEIGTNGRVIAESIAEARAVSAKIDAPEGSREN